MSNLVKIICICLFVVTKINAEGSIGINSGLYNTLPRPVISAGTMEYGEIRGYSLHGNSMDDGFLRLSAGAGTTPWTKTYIDMSGYSTVPDMNRNIVFGTSGTERMRINLDGNVGIGTSTPATKLSVLGGISKLTETGVDGAFDNLIKYGHKSDLESSTNYANRWHGIDATITAGPAEQNKLKFKLYSGGTVNLVPVDVMTLVGNGRVGIGTTNPDSKLTVAGNIHVQEVKVTVNAGVVPDYVFANDYKLKSLEEVEAYIRQNKHLPEIPSARDVEKNGLMLAEMNMNLLKKMEEMTLYMIEQNKKIEKQNEKIRILEEKVFAK